MAANSVTGTRNNLTCMNASLPMENKESVAQTAGKSGFFRYFDPLGGYRPAAFRINGNHKAPEGSRGLR